MNKKSIFDFIICFILAVAIYSSLQWRVEGQIRSMQVETSYVKIEFPERQPPGNWLSHIVFSDLILDSPPGATPKSPTDRLLGIHNRTERFRLWTSGLPSEEIGSIQWEPTSKVSSINVSLEKEEYSDNGNMLLVKLKANLEGTLAVKTPGECLCTLDDLRPVELRSNYNRGYTFSVAGPLIEMDILATREAIIAFLEDPLLKKDKRKFYGTIRYDPPHLSKLNGSAVIELDNSHKKMTLIDFDINEFPGLSIKEISQIGNNPGKFQIRLEGKIVPTIMFNIDRVTSGVLSISESENIDFIEEVTPTYYEKNQFSVWFIGSLFPFALARFFKNAANRSRCHDNSC